MMSRCEPHARPLRERERRFVDALIGEAGGNGARAARLAGYRARNLRPQASRLLTKGNVQRAIAERQAERAQQAIADANERDIILTTIARDVTADTCDRIAAIRELNRVSGRHSKHYHHSGRLTLEEVITASREPREAQ